MEGMMIEPLSRVKAKYDSRKDMFLEAEKALKDRLEIDLERERNVGKGRTLTITEIAQLIERDPSTLHRWGVNEFRDRDYYELEAWLKKKKRTKDLKKLRSNWNS